MYQNQFNKDGFEWVDLNHRDESVVAYRRKGKKKADDLLILLNLTPVVRSNWEILTYGKKFGKEVFNSDELRFGGTGDVLNPDIQTEMTDKKSRLYKHIVNLPALGGIVLK